jgi:DNA topoisomerase-1
MMQPAALNGDFAPRKLAQLARLRYVSDGDAGYSRQRNGRGFKYQNSRGKPLHQPRELHRVEQLAVPPAWTDVWICRYATGHLQATGRDDRKRKQYLYHERWRAIANLAKFIHIEQFGKALPKLRSAIAHDLFGRKLTRKRVLAGMVAVLDTTSIRVGNEEYVRQNGSFGLTTLRTRHVKIIGRRADLQFRAKGGLKREVVIDDPRLVGFLSQLKRLRGNHVFQYLDEEGHVCPITSVDVNDYLREVSGHPFTAKDFRTWKASALAAGLLFRESQASSQRERKRAIKSVIAAAADLLANTVTVCRKYYVHSALLESYERGELGDHFRGFKSRGRSHFTNDEQVLSHFLRRWSSRPSRMCGSQSGR